MYFGQDIDAMIEARNAREWEEQNKVAEPDYAEIEMHISDALDYLRETMMALADAMVEAKDSPEEARIRSLVDDIESLQNDAASMRARMKEVKSA